MGEDPSTGGQAVTGASDPNGASDPEQIETEIEQTRQELGDTVEALARKADVKEQAKQKIEDTKATVSEKKEQLLGQARQASPDSASAAATQVSQTARQNPLPLAAAGALAVGFLIGRITKRR